MRAIKFINFQQVNPDDFLPLVNEPALRQHLIDHDRFDSISIREWVQAKLEVDALPGCRVRAVYIDGALAGWCAIQPDDRGFELAIVLSQQFWGCGISIFKTLMGWAKALGHQQVLFHLLDSRPEYRALRRLATRVQTTELLGRCFTTYYLSVDQWRVG